MLCTALLYYLIMTCTGCMGINTGGILLAALKVLIITDAKTGHLLHGVKKFSTHPLLPKAQLMPEQWRNHGYRQGLLGVYDILPIKQPIEKDTNSDNLKTEAEKNHSKQHHELMMAHAIANTPRNIRHLLWKPGKGFHPTTHPLNLPMPNAITSIPNHLRKLNQAWELSKPYFQDHGRGLLRKGASIFYDRFFASDEQVRLAAARNIIFVRQSMGMFKKIFHANRILGYYLFSLRHVERQLHKFTVAKGESVKSKKFIKNSDESFKFLDKIKNYRILIEKEVFKNCIKVVFSPHAPDLCPIIKYYVATLLKYHLSSDADVRYQAAQDLKFLKETCNTVLMLAKL